MNTDVLHVAGIYIEVIQKPIKNLHIGVYPPDGRVRVAAPPSMSLDAVRVALLTRLPWIERKRRGFALQPREGRRAYVSGETHFFLGRPLRLRVEAMASGRCGLALEGSDGLRMRVRPGAGFSDRERMVLRWYREELRARGGAAVAKWADLLGVSRPLLGVKRMRTKWGSCNPLAGRVWLNLSLSKKPPQAIEYVALHEVAHFLSPRHDDAFIAVLDQWMPSWQKARAELNAMPLDNWDEESGPILV
ncbi:M48 family metallopeptidase [Pseudaestuariivita rosea]|uniref:M48 family metallopeptidase n=1 Tax=Pseudaestuariivita rosea TaxID=2763263 RepID=UPI001ABAE7AC|nr:SprT family zinc-dependent metalloprotease [Pseudaestuariivita rosea]